MLSRYDTQYLIYDKFLNDTQLNDEKKAIGTELELKKDNNAFKRLKNEFDLLDERVNATEIYEIYKQVKDLTINLQNQIDLEESTLKNV